MHRYLFTSLLLLYSFSAWPQTGAADGLLLTDSTTAVASFGYQAQSFLHRFFMGSNYRRQWQTEVRVPLFRLSASPFSIVNLGGGMQTKSLLLRDARARYWSLRMVDKDVEGAVPKPLRHTLAQRVLQDQISSALPYGAVVVGNLASAAGIATARPSVVMVQEDKALKELNDVFAGKLCMLEERDAGFDSTFVTADVLQSMQRGAGYRVDQRTYLKARLLDMLIADWDRHAGNWRWGLHDSAGTKWWVPLPRDRDWAFYQSGGALPWLAQKTKALRHLVNFGSTPKKLTDQSWKAWPIDRLFLNQLTWKDWEESLKELRASLTDAVIEEAVKDLPTSIYESIGEAMATKLKSRRDEMRDELIKYYHFEAEDVLIEGSDDPEMIRISSDGDALLIAISCNNKRLYQRRFLYPETISVTINSKGGDDVFSVDEKASSRIRLRLVGGEGTDSYRLNGSLRVKVQDSQP